MHTIRTVLGDIAADELGFTMAHEHILTHPQGSGSKAEIGHHLDSVEKAIEMLVEFKEVGGGAIVETTPESWGRNTPGMVEAGRAKTWIVEQMVAAGLTAQSGASPSDRS